MPELTRREYRLPRGTHDILPDQAPAWQWLEGTFREVCRRYHLQEIRTPMFEATELFDRSAGASSDVMVTKQMYSFIAPDEQSYSLRPEGTAPVVRAFIEHHLNERGPVSKLFYTGPMFRYEAPQAGRYRQHHQCGVEFFGAAGAAADAELLLLSRDFLAALGVKATLHLNTLGTLASRQAYVEKLQAFLTPHATNLSPDSQKRLQLNPLRIFDSKDERDHHALQGAPSLLEHLREHDPASFEHFNELQSLLTEAGVPFEVDEALVRGFDYYTHTAFEWVTDQLGAQSTVLGGGRYDGLVEELGGPPTPAVGFGSGIERLLLLCEAGGTPLPAITPLPAFVVALGEAARPHARRLLQEVRHAGIAADSDLSGRSMKAQMREANRMQTRLALIIGENEVTQGVVAVKEMASGEQHTIVVGDLIPWLQRRLTAEE